MVLGIIVLGTMMFWSMVLATIVLGGHGVLVDGVGDHCVLDHGIGAMVLGNMVF